DLESDTTGLSAPLPPRAAAVKLAQTAYTCLRSSGGEGSGVGGRLCAIAPPPTRRAALRRRATLPTAIARRRRASTRFRRGEGWCPQLRLCPLQRCVHALVRKRGPTATDRRG